MRSITMEWMRRSSMVVMGALGLLAASAAQAGMFEDALGRLGARDVAALRAAPPALMQAMADASAIASDWKEGRLPANDAAPAAADAVNRLGAHWRELAAAPAATRWVVHQVALVVIAGDVRSLMIAAEWRTDGPLARAIGGWLDESARMRPLLNPAPPRNPCFQGIAGCYSHCSNAATWWERSLCGLDCELDFAQCMGGALGGVLGGILDAARSGSRFP